MLSLTKSVNATISPMGRHWYPLTGEKFNPYVLSNVTKGKKGKFQRAYKKA